MSEQHYDEVIAPKLVEIAELCIAAGMSFIATVEYEPTKRGTTRVIGPNSCLAMHMQNHCANTAPNIDGYIFGIAKYCNREGIDMSSSITMQPYIAKPQPDQPAQEVDK
ncbi:Hypothetical protein HEAR2314 [Herminiimonas arsenicoxydans]|uniref:Uncharacterized protein n=1 Tax=Herminiimonas arsenicoxydans TaxID=204773 RepID=A4G7F8_HERAR|nr:Hypothetical protein HEAR2314 [Herminiimonas arsenicoxydans]